MFPSPRSKVHQLRYVALDPSSEESDELLAVSTEDGRIIFYSTKQVHQAEEGDDSPIPYAEAVAQIGGRAAGYSGRVKDFDVMSLKDEGAAVKNDFLITTGNSEGVVRVWYVRGEELAGKKKTKKAEAEQKPSAIPTVGKLLGAYNTDYRITCMKAFVMLAPEDSPTFAPESKESEESEDESEESDDE